MTSKRNINSRIDDLKDTDRTDGDDGVRVIGPAGEPLDIPVGELLTGDVEVGYGDVDRTTVWVGGEPPEDDRG